mmetsp:Transcript_22684/g.21866  ORF Transcript_22684/g.21866 Transcript_22684/m.21866 type:complete len:85 (-) Transcript_22684:56-310(-)
MERWLSESNYLCGDELSIADLMGASELFQTQFIDMKLERWPKVQAWLHKMVYEVPSMNEAHEPLRKLVRASKHKNQMDTHRTKL